VGDSSKRKTVVTGFSLDPKVSDGIITLAEEIGTNRSRLVNYLLDRALKAMTRPEIIDDEQEYKKKAVSNQTLMFSGAGLQKWSLVIDLEFSDSEA